MGYVATAVISAAISGAIGFLIGGVMAMGKVTQLLDDIEALKAEVRRLSRELEAVSSSHEVLCSDELFVA